MTATNGAPAMTGRERYVNALLGKPTDMIAVGSPTSLATYEQMRLLGVEWPEAHYSAEAVALLAERSYTDLGFDTIASEGCFFRPPLPSARMLRRLQVFESVGPRLWPGLCGTWFLVARKRTATLTSLRPGWRRRRKPIREAGLAGPAMCKGGRYPAEDAA